MTYWKPDILNNIRKGFYSAVYFNRTQQILLQEKNLTPVTMQVFQKQDNTVVAGIDLLLELFKHTVGYYDHNEWVDKSDEITIQTISDGSITNSWETIMHITGPYAYFAHIESIYLGILARASKIATNTKRVVNAAGNKQVMFFADRFDYFLNQELDGYAAKLAGVTRVATEAQSFWWDGKPMGTIPHALIAMHEGNTIAAAESFIRQYPHVPLIVLADFENDCVKTSLEVARRFGNKLFGVRLDTSEKLIDKSLEQMSSRVSEATRDPNGVSLASNADRSDSLNGVNPQLVNNVRQALDAEGFNHVKIVVSGGFTEDKIKQFEREQTPVNIYGVGSSLLKGSIDFTADIVKVGDKELAKEGRKYKKINI